MSNYQLKHKRNKTTQMSDRVTLSSSPPRPSYLKIPELICRETLIIISPLTAKSTDTPLFILSDYLASEEQEREHWPPTPIKFRCRECKIEVLSDIIFVNGEASVRLSLIIVAVVGGAAILTCGIGLLFLPLALIPLVVKKWKDVKHICPGCKMPHRIFKKKFWKRNKVTQEPHA